MKTLDQFINEWIANDPENDEFCTRGDILNSYEEYLLEQEEAE